MPPLHIAPPPPASPSPSASVSPSYRRTWSSAASPESSSAQSRPVEGSLPRPSAAHGGVQPYTLRGRLAHREISAPPLVDTGSTAEESGKGTYSHIRFPSVDEFGLPLRRQSSPPPRYSLHQEDEPHHEDSSFIPISDEKSRVVAQDKRLDAKAISSSDFQSQPTTSHDDASNAQDNESGAATSKTPKPKVSEWSYQHMNVSEGEDEEEEEDDDGGWKDMPALGELDYYDDTGHLVAKAGGVEEADDAVYQGLGGAGKGYTRIQVDDDVRSVTSLDDDTKYLFREPESNTIGIDDDEPRDPLSQMQTTKELLTEGQRIAYVGLTRLMIHQMTKEVKDVEHSRAIKKFFAEAIDGLSKWGQKIMMRLYMHMDISAEEQIMIEQLSQHGVMPEDLVPTLMQNASVKNPMSSGSNRTSVSSAIAPASHDKHGRPRSMASESIDSVSASNVKCPVPKETAPDSKERDNHDDHEDGNDDDNYNNDDESVPEVHGPSHIPTEAKIDIDLRWTVLCDLFLVLISDSVYDARSRQLLERVGNAMDVSWRKICRFEKRVVDALEMQQQDPKEHWEESDNMEKRRKLALKKRYLVMGLATVGGGLIIGLSAGLLAPVIGAGLAAGFTTVGITGTGAFLGGVGGTALITSSATLAGGTIAIRASDRRTGAVKTFEYRPLHNNKRLNLIITVSGWMTGKIDDVRLPFSTIDPIMGDIYSILWEPEMLQSIGDTINILATEALTQGLQQVLGSTVLVALMASLQLPLLLTKLAYLIDNPWSVSLDRATAAGLILADSLMQRNLGHRPVTLVGFSLGSRVIFSCLKELANKKALGLIQNVYLFGSPIVANKDEYLTARTAVAGRFVNGYASNDWILGYLFRATSGGIMRVAGLAPVELPGIENVNLTEFVTGHMAYRAAIPRIMRHLGWDVESDEFAEIEEPDPENHTERQRELIRELDEARRAAGEDSGKKRFGIFKRNKNKKKEWENIIVERRNSMDSPLSPSSSHTDDSGRRSTVLFDIDAIRAELAGEHIDVKELESTLPPIKLDLNSPSQSDIQKGNETIATGNQSKEKEAKDKLTVDTSVSQKESKNLSYEYDETVDADPHFASSIHEPLHDYPNAWQSGSDITNLPDRGLAWSDAHHILDPHEDEHIEMTFGTSFEEPSALESYSHTTHEPPPIEPSRENRASIHQASFDHHGFSSYSPPRAAAVAPEEKTALTSVTPVLSHLPPARNVWAEDEFGHGDGDDGVHMTFE